jgi:hypothetical protein
MIILLNQAKKSDKLSNLHPTRGRIDQDQMAGIASLLAERQGSGPAQACIVVEDGREFVLAGLAGKKIHLWMPARGAAKREQLPIQIGAMLAGEIWNAVVLSDSIEAVAWRAFQHQAR